MCIWVVTMVWCECRKKEVCKETEHKKVSYKVLWSHGTYAVLHVRVWRVMLGVVVLVLGRVYRQAQVQRFQFLHGGAVITLVIVVPR